MGTKRTRSTGKRDSKGRIIKESDSSGNITRSAVAASGDTLSIKSDFDYAGDISDIDEDDYEGDLPYSDYDDDDDWRDMDFDPTSDDYDDDIFGDDDLDGMDIFDEEDRDFDERQFYRTLGSSDLY